MTSLYADRDEYKNTKKNSQRSISVYSTAIETVTESPPTSDNIRTKQMSNNCATRNHTPTFTNKVYTDIEDSPEPSAIPFTQDTLSPSTNISHATKEVHTDKKTNGVQQDSTLVTDNFYSHQAIDSKGITLRKDIDLPESYSKSDDIIYTDAPLREYDTNNKYMITTPTSAVCETLIGKATNIPINTKDSNPIKDNCYLHQAIDSKAINFTSTE